MSDSPKKPKVRVQRVNSLIQELLGPVLVEYCQDAGNGLVTISKVETSPDMRHAKIWLSILGGQDETIFSSIKKNIYDIQGELNRSLNMKIIPRLEFALDTSPRNAQHISELFQRIHQQNENS